MTAWHALSGSRHSSRPGQGAAIHELGAPALLDRCARTGPRRPATRSGSLLPTIQDCLSKFFSEADFAARGGVVPGEERLEVRQDRILQDSPFSYARMAASFSHRLIVYPASGSSTACQPASLQPRDFAGFCCDVLVGAFIRIPRSRLELSVNDTQHHGFLPYVAAALAGLAHCHFRPLEILAQSCHTVDRCCAGCVLVGIGLADVMLRV